MYTYYTKEEIEAKLSKIEACGNVIVDMGKDNDTILVKYGSDGVFEKSSADDIAKKVTSNDKACATVDCDEGMMVFGSDAEKNEYKGY